MRLSKHLYLTGYRATGKTSVAKHLGRRCGLPTTDLDAEIVAASKKTIAEIFAEQSESGFRDRESEQLEIVAQLPPRIISLGGGAILRPQNRALIARTGHCVWLTADVDSIARRISADSSTASQRPGLTNLSLLSEIRAVLERRTPIYQAVADFVIETDEQSVDQIAETILIWLSEKDA